MSPDFAESNMKLVFSLKVTLSAWYLHLLNYDPSLRLKFIIPSLAVRISSIKLNKGLTVSLKRDIKHQE